jgi:signal transduction histidine kinase
VNQWKLHKWRELFSANFRIKVLVPVVVVMVLLMAVTSWIISRRIQRQMENEARRALNAAGDAFHDWRANRTKNLLLRFGDLRNEPRYRAAFQTRDPATIQVQLIEMLRTADADVNVVLFTPRESQQTSMARRDPVVSQALIESAMNDVVTHAMHGEEIVDTVQIDEKLYDVIGVPVLDPVGETIGTLTFAVELGTVAAMELSRFTRSQVVFVADDRVVATTLATSSSMGRFTELFKASVPKQGSSVSMEIRDERFDGRHYYCSAGRLGSSSDSLMRGFLLLYSYEDSWRALMTTQEILAVTNTVGILVAVFVVCVLVGKVTSPLLELRRNAEAVGRGDFSGRVEVSSNDECGELARVFNQMTENLRGSREQLEAAQAELVEASRRAGMAEVATGVLHNVGNVLTSVNVASSLIERSVKASRTANLGKLVALMREHEADLGTFLTRDERGREIFAYLGQLSEHLVQEQEATLEELARLQKGLEHIRDIVKAQQGYAKMSGAVAELAVNDLVEDALRMNLSSRPGIEVVRELEDGLKIKGQKHQVLQILVNLIRNATQSCDSSRADTKRVAIRARQQDGMVSIAVTDNGVGIARENLSRLFTHGFTTKQDGHGFGLNSCATAAKDLGGVLRAHSDGPDKGATFTLEIPTGD